MGMISVTSLYHHPRGINKDEALLEDLREVHRMYSISDLMDVNLCTKSQRIISSICHPITS